MGAKERAKWLKWGKMKMCVPRENEHDTDVSNIQETLENLLKRQEEMETNFYMYLKATKPQDVHVNKRKK